MKGASVIANRTTKMSDEGSSGGRLALRTLALSAAALTIGRRHVVVVQVGGSRDFAHALLKWKQAHFVALRKSG